MLPSLSRNAGFFFKSFLFIYVFILSFSHSIPTTPSTTPNTNASQSDSSKVQLCNESSSTSRTERRILFKRAMNKGDRKAVIDDEDGVPEAPPPGLESISTYELAKQKNKLIQALKRKKLGIEGNAQEALESNPSFNVKGALDLLDNRMERLDRLERVLVETLQLYSKVVTAKNIDAFDLLMESESNLMIDQFQKLVLKAKNEKLLEDHTKKVEDKARLSGEYDVNDPKASSSSSSPGVGTGGVAAGASSSSGENTGDEMGGTIDGADSPTSIENVLKDVSDKADTLEDEIKEDKFQEGQMQKGSTIETVIKIGGSGAGAGGDSGSNKNWNSTSLNDDLTSGKSSSSDSDKPGVLVDSKNNQYVLSKPGDATAHIEDTALMKDILLLLVSCFLAVIVAFILRLPTFFGYMVAGILLCQYKVIENSVQVETISRGLGVIFIMFFLGLEFNFGKIAKVWTISLIGSFCLLFITLAFACTVLPLLLRATFAESIVIGSSIFLSSTAVVVHFLGPAEAETGYGRSIMGVLVAQDVLLGFLLAIMPVLEKSSEEIAFTAGRLILLLCAFLVVSYVIRTPLLFSLDYIFRKGKREFFALSSIGVLLLYVRLGLVFEQSVELSCFVGGVMIASYKQLGSQVSHATESIKELFGALFFASIGLHIYPSFLYQEGLLLISLTLFIMTFKILVTTLVIHFIFRKRLRHSFIIGVGLAQISEFTFVLSSTAKSAGILSRELFFILIGVTGISMFLSPFIWRIAVYFFPPDKVSKEDETVNNVGESNLSEVLLSFERRSIDEGGGGGASSKFDD